MWVMADQDEPPAELNLFSQLAGEEQEIPEHVQKRMAARAVAMSAEDQLDDDDAWDVTIYATIDSLNHKLRDDIDNVNSIVGSYLERPESERTTDPTDVTQIAKQVLIVDDLLTYFVVVQDTIEIFTIQLLEDGLVIEPYKNSNKTTKLLRRSMNQRQREAILKRFGVLDHKVVDKMGEVRTLRNDLVHDSVYREEVEFDRPLIEIIELPQKVLNKFHEIKHGEQFWQKKQEDDED